MPWGQSPCHPVLLCVTCPRSTWVPLGDYIASNTDECTATLMYAVNLKQSGTVSFEYIYPDSSIVFEFFVGAGCRAGVLGSQGGVPLVTPSLSPQVQNDQCQPTVEESRWMRTTEKGWEFHSVSEGDGGGTGGSTAQLLGEAPPGLPPRVLVTAPPEGSLATAPLGSSVSSHSSLVTPAQGDAL